MWFRVYGLDTRPSGRRAAGIHGLAPATHVHISTSEEEQIIVFNCLDLYQKSADSGERITDVKKAIGSRSEGWRELMRELVAVSVSLGAQRAVVIITRTLHAVLQGTLGYRV